MKAIPSLNQGPVKSNSQGRKGAKPIQGLMVPMKEGNVNRPPAESKDTVGSCVPPVLIEGTHDEARSDATGDHGHEAFPCLCPQELGGPRLHEGQQGPRHGPHRDLKMLADELNVGYSAKMGHGEMRLHLRRWLYRQGNEETMVSFGRHAGKTFGQVSQQDLQYLQLGSEGDTDTRRGKLAADPDGDLGSALRPSGQPVRPWHEREEERSRRDGLDAILAIDPEVFVKHIEPKTPETGGSHGSKAASSQAKASTETELILTLRALKVKDEVRALSEKTRRSPTKRTASRIAIESQIHMC